MASNHHNHNQSQNSGALYNAQCRWWEMLTPTQVATGEQQS
jgi:hypothetical protein